MDSELSSIQRGEAGAWRLKKRVPRRLIDYHFRVTVTRIGCCGPLLGLLFAGQEQAGGERGVIALVFLRMTLPLRGGSAGEEIGTCPRHAGFLSMAGYTNLLDQETIITGCKKKKNALH